MKGRSPLLAAVAASLLLHAAAIGVGELLTGNDRPPPPPDDFTVEYPTLEAPPSRAEAGRSDATPEQRSISLDTPDPVYRPYFSTLTRAIEDAWHDPAPEKGDPEGGSVVIEFTVGASGDLQAVSVKRSSGARNLDLAAVKAVKTAAPFAEIPPEIATAELTIQALFVYD